ncbi:N-6 DNA methylase, partial [candidate division KSB1 bacterium]|nr:N-6 DNA methylase [candidate division KSB1 bacterium]
SDIRKWIIENDWLEAIVAMPDQLFYNTGIYTYIWIISNRKPTERRGKVQLINAVSYFQKMGRSLGNKRHEIGDGEDGQPDQIAAITRIYGNFQHDQSLAGEKGAAIPVSKIFDNEDFGYWRITVERPLRLNFQTSPERIARLDDETAFKNLAKSRKKGEAAKKEVAAGRAEQLQIKALLDSMDAARLYQNRDEFEADLQAATDAAGYKLYASIKKAILNALSERDETADICTDNKGNPEPDSSLRDYENVPLKEDIQKYFEREVLPHIPDAWIDEKRTVKGYEISFTRYFYQYKPLRPLAEIRDEILALEKEMYGTLAEVLEV